MTRAGTRQVCTFSVLDFFFGVEVEHVQEVLRFQPMTQVPLAPPIVRGLINLRGQIVIAVDLRRRLGLPERVGELPMNIVVRADGGPVSLLVDEIGDVVEVNEDAFEQAPETLQGPSRTLVRGVYQLASRLLLVLDLEQSVNGVLEAAGSRRSAA